MSELRLVIIDEEEFFYSLSFDIDDFIGSGIWWLQIYNYNQELIYDKPFVSSIGEIDEHEIKEIIKDKFLRYRKAVL